MRKIGTITKYYPFIDEETKNTLDSIQNEAHNYNDFVIQLSKELSRTDAPEALAHIGVLLSYNAQITEANYRIGEKYGNLLCVKPWIIKLDAKNEREAIDNLISSNPPSFILFQAYLHKTGILYLVPYAFDSLQAAKDILDANPEMNCFIPEFLMHKIMLLRYEGDAEKVYQLGMDALEKAKECDDVISEIDVLTQQTEFLMNTDVQRAFSYTQSAYTLAKELGTPYLVAAAVMGFGMLSTIIGEYDLALHAYTESVETLQALNAPMYHIPIRISQIYSDLEDGRSALEWAKQSLEIEETKQPQGGLEDHLCPHIAMARALIVTGLLEEASEYVYKSREIALRSGQEMLLSDYYYVQGIYDLNSGDISGGIDTLARGLEICDRTSRGQRLKNRFLLALTKAEVDSFDFLGRTSYDPDDSGPWMTLLEQECRQKGLHGLKMQHALLKAEFQKKLGLCNVAMETLEDALNSFDSPGVVTLRGKIHEKIRALRETPLSP